MGFATKEGLLPALLFLVLPFLILWVLVKVLPPWTAAEHQTEPGLAAVSAGRARTAASRSGRAGD